MARDIRNAEISLRITDQASQTGAGASKQLAIVSPCSTCQNFTQTTASTGNDLFRSLCPRRIWINQYQNNPDEANLVDPVLYTSGTPNPNTLANPVVDPVTNNYVVWVANLEDNPGIVDPASG